MGTAKQVPIPFRSQMRSQDSTSETVNPDGTPFAVIRMDAHSTHHLCAGFVGASLARGSDRDESEVAPPMSVRACDGVE